MDLWKLSLNDSVNGTVGTFKKKQKTAGTFFGVMSLSEQILRYYNVFE